MVKQALQRSSDPVDLAQLEPSSPMVWAIRNVRLPKGAPWDFTHRAWQSQIFDDPARKLVIIKPTQIGMTTIALTKMLHYATYNSVRAMYTLPRQDDVYDLVNGRLERMFMDSPMLASYIGSVDNVRLKTYGRSYLHFMESSVPPRMLDVDVLINDEVDISNQDHLEQYIARLDASEFGIHTRLSTPTITNFGIDAIYRESTQNVWYVKCERCNHEQELTWEGNVAIRGSDAWLLCERCGKQLTPETVQAGRWIPSSPSREIVGYSISQLMVTSIPLSRLVSDFKTMRTKNFYNLRLGKPYTPAIGGMSRDAIIQNCFVSEHTKENTGGGYFIGADQGNDIHVVVAKVEEDKVKIVHMEVIPLEEGFDRLQTLAYRYGVRKMVLDGLPNRHSALSLAKSFKSNQVRVAFYSPSDRVYKESPSEPQVNINRTMAFDVMQDAINTGRLQFYGTRTSLDTITRLAMSHISNMRRDEVISHTAIGGEKVEIAWVNTGADHFAHAISYLLVAVDSSSQPTGFRVATVGDEMTEIDSGFSDRTTVPNNNPYLRNTSLREALKRSRRGGFIR